VRYPPFLLAILLAFAFPYASRTTANPNTPLYSNSNADQPCLMTAVKQEIPFAFFSICLRRPISPSAGHYQGTLLTAVIKLTRSFVGSALLGPALLVSWSYRPTSILSLTIEQQINCQGSQILSIFFPKCTTFVEIRMANYKFLITIYETT
jgi:hypothetical protein